MTLQGMVVPQEYLMCFSFNVCADCSKYQNILHIQWSICQDECFCFWGCRLFFFCFFFPDFPHPLCPPDSSNWKQAKHVSDYWKFFKAGPPCGAEDVETRAYWFRGNVLRRARAIKAARVWAERLVERSVPAGRRATHITGIHTDARRAEQRSHEWGRCYLKQTSFFSCFEGSFSISATA